YRVCFPSYSDHRALPLFPTRRSSDLDRFIMLFGKAAINKEAFLRGLKKHIYAGDLEKAIAYVAGQKKTPLTAVVKAGLINVPKEIGRHTSELQSRENLVCRLLLEKKK